VSNSGGIKLSTCQSLGLKPRGHVDDGCGGVPHVERFIQQRFEHQRDRQTDWTQPQGGLLSAPHPGHGRTGIPH